MNNKSGGQKHFYGATTVGEKGQVVIPAEARDAMKLKKGEKLLVFGMGCDMITLSKFSDMEKRAKHLAEKAEEIRAILKKSK